MIQVKPAGLPRPHASPLPAAGRAPFPHILLPCSPSARPHLRIPRGPRAGAGGPGRGVGTGPPWRTGPRRGAALARGLRGVPGKPPAAARRRAVPTPRRREAPTSCCRTHRNIPGGAGRGPRGGAPSAAPRPPLSSSSSSPPPPQASRPPRLLPMAQGPDAELGATQLPRRPRPRRLPAPRRRRHHRAAADTPRLAALRTAPGK